MAQDKVTYRPLSFKETLATLQPVDKPTTSPQELKEKVLHVSLLQSEIIQFYTCLFSDKF